MAWTERDNEKFKMIGGLNTVHSKYFNIAISYSQKEEDIALEALDCYKSQLNVSVVEEWRNVELKDTLNTFYFRKLNVSSIRKNAFD